MCAVLLSVLGVVLSVILIIALACNLHLFLGLNIRAQKGIRAITTHFHHCAVSKDTEDDEAVCRSKPS